jgi:methionyl-tRNA formyltransferase
VYSLARLGAFNVHASLLPRYRGAAPINHAIIYGEHETGVTSFLLNDVVDTGTIIQQLRHPIADGTTAGELYEQLKPLAATCAVNTTRMLLDGTSHPAKQDDALATPAPKVFRETSVINWQQPASAVRNVIHGLSPVPCAWTLWNGEVLKVFRATHTQAPCPPGQWMVRGLELVAGCADGALTLTEVQLPGKRRMAVADVLRGYRGTMSGSFASPTDAP